MRKFLIAGMLILVISISATNGKKAATPQVHESNLSSTIDSLISASDKLEASTDRMNKTLSKIK